MIILGLTGGIASGKSTVAQMLVEMGARVWDADQAARRVVMPGQPGLEALRRAFGPAFIREDGTLDRAGLGRHVFGNPERVTRLNATLHPYILLDMEETLARWRQESVRVGVLMAPLLFEAGIDRQTHAVWTLSCSEGERARRIMARDGLSEDEAWARLKAQLTDEERARRAHRVIDTGGSLEDTRRQVEKLYQELLEDNRCAGSSDGC